MVPVSGQLEPVRFEIRLIDHIKTISVAKRVPIRVVGVMGIADGIDIVSLHQQNIFFHLVRRHPPASVRVKFVVIYTFQLDRFSVKKELLVY